MSGSSAAVWSSAGSRLTRSALIYGLSWCFGAVALTSVQVAYSNRHPPASASQPTPAPAGPTESASVSPLPIYGDGVAAAGGPSATAHETERNLLKIAQAFADCSQAHTLSVQPYTCTEELIINFVGTSPKDGQVDWSVLRLLFAQTLLFAYKNNNEIRDGQILWQEVSTVSEGLKYQLGSEAAIESDNLDAAGVSLRSAPDSEKAVQLYRGIADAGNPNAQILLGLAYKTGFGVWKSDAQAIAYFSQAAKRVRAASLLEAAVRNATPAGK